MSKKSKKKLAEMTPRERNAYRRKKRKKRRRVILIIELLILALLAGAVYLMTKLGSINFTEIGPVKKNKLDARTQNLLSGYTNIALFGLDNRENGKLNRGNSDSIMVASINNKTKEVRIVSVYRDTYLDIDGEGTLRKANSAYSKGGPKQAIEMLNRNLDLDIEDYITVDFNALVEAIDAVGGVDVDVSEEEVQIIKEKGYAGEVAYVTGHEDEDQPIKPGTGVHLNGVQATAWCRIRYTASQDYGRANRQRIVVEQLIQKAKKASPAQLDKLITGVFPDIATSMSVTELIGLASGVQGYELKGQTGFPFAVHSANLGKKAGSVVVPCTLESNVKALYEYLYDETDYTPSDTVKSISKSVKQNSGLDEKDALNYGYGTELTEDEGSSVK